MKMASNELVSQNGGSWIAKMQKGFQDNAFLHILTLRFIPVVPFFAINIAAAFFQIPFRSFLFGTFLGIIPGCFVYISIGVGLRELIEQPGFTGKVILDSKILIALTGLGILSFMPT